MLLYTTALFAQEQGIRVFVSDSEGALPHAHVFVNENPISATNTSGEAIIRQKSLQIGDTISATYIGMQPVFRIYDEQIRQSGKCDLLLAEQDVYLLESATVIGYDKKDSRKIFRKNVKTHPQLLQNCVITAQFSCEITLADKTARILEGSFILKNNIPRGSSNQDIPKLYFNAMPEIITNSDTTHVYTELLGSIRYVYRGACNIIGELDLEHSAARPHSNLYYLGLKDGQRFFRYTNSDPNYRSGSQILFDSDIEPQELKTIKYTTMSRSGEQFDIYNIDLSCRKLSSMPTRGRGASVINVPEDIVAKIRRVNGTETELKIDSIVIQFVD